MNNRLKGWVPPQEWQLEKMLNIDIAETGERQGIFQ